MSPPPPPVSDDPARADRHSLHDVLDPRSLQVGFAVAFLLAIGLIVLGGSSLAVASLLGSATMLCLGTTALALVVPWKRLSHPASALLPVLDIAAIGIAALDSSGWACTPLLVLPVLWMAGQFHRRGALGAGLAAVLLFALPSIVHLGPGNGTLAWSLLVPLAVTVLGIALVEGNDRLNADRAELARQRLALQEAGATISQQRRFGDALLDTLDVGLALLDEQGAIARMN